MPYKINLKCEAFKHIFPFEGGTLSEKLNYNCPLYYVTGLIDNLPGNCMHDPRSLSDTCLSNYTCIVCIYIDIHDFVRQLGSRLCTEHIGFILEVPEYPAVKSISCIQLNFNV